MPFLQDHPRFKGIRLPPSGWVLAVLLVVYICTGLIGHDPWKHDDAITIGVVKGILADGQWLTLHLAGNAYPDAPFYYWFAAFTAKAFSWLLPTHDAVRLASGLFTLLALEFILLAGRELHGKEHAAAAPLLLAGSIGFLYHAHEAQPMLAALTAQTAAYWALALMPRRPRIAVPALGAAIALAFLSNGLLPLGTLVPPILIAWWLFAPARRDALHVLGALLLAAALIALWIVPLQAQAPDYLAAFLRGESGRLTRPLAPLSNALHYLSLLLWYAWPALPLAGWALWFKRRQLRVPAQAFPLFAFIAVLAMLTVSVEQRSAEALLLLPPLVLLATPGVAGLRRGAANAFDWFAMMSFTLFAGVAWVAWSALAFGWPERLARQAVRLEPGFVGQFEFLPWLYALAATLTWFWLIATSPRSPMRGLMHWMAGVTLFWLLVSMLWMPWIDYGKSYRRVADEIAAALPAQRTCIANVNLSDAVLASLDYFRDIRTRPAESASGRECDWLLVHGAVRSTTTLRAAGWREVLDAGRPTDRSERNKIRLFHRDARKKSGALPDLTIDSNEDRQRLK